MNKVSSEKQYEEVGANYRFFLGWRHATMAGYIGILFGAGKLALAEPSYLTKAFIFLIALFLGIFFWLFDYRTRQLYNAAVRSGKHLEQSKNGFYALIYSNIKKENFIKSVFNRKYFFDSSHSKVIDKFFLVTLIILLILTGFCLHKYY